MTDAGVIWFISSAISAARSCRAPGALRPGATSLVYSLLLAAAGGMMVAFNEHEEFLTFSVTNTLLMLAVSFIIRSGLREESTWILQSSLGYFFFATIIYLSM